MFKTRVIKRDGSIEKFNVGEISKRIYDLDPNFNQTELIRYVLDGICIGGDISTFDIDRLIGSYLAGRFIENPELIKLATNLEISNLHKSTPKSFYDYFIKVRNLFSAIPKKMIEDNMEFINNIVNSDFDYRFDFKGIRTLMNEYLIRIGGIVERPQYLLARAAIMASGGSISFFKDLYFQLSSFKIMLSTPVLYNACIEGKQMAPCYIAHIIKTDRDSLDKMLSYCENILSNNGGLGIDVTAIGSLSEFSLEEFIERLQSLCLSVDTLEKRRPQTAVSLKMWHYRIEEFMSMKSAKEELSFPELFYSIMVPDIFWRRYNDDKIISLFDPDIAPELNNTHSGKFEDKYLEYERRGLFVKQISARKLFRILAINLQRTGNPNVLNIDIINRLSNESNIGMVHNTNLCTEIMQTTDDRISVCSLGSLGLPMFIENGEFNFEELAKSVGILVRALNNILDSNIYPTGSKVSDNRPIGVGIRGLADMFIKLRIPFISEKSKDLNTKIFESIYYNSLLTSMNLAKENGPYQRFRGSPISKGFLPMMYYGITEPTLPWNDLIKSIKRYGVRNSLLVALAPTVATSQITGMSESFEPIDRVVYIKKVRSGNFQDVHPEFYKILKERGISWEKILPKLKEKRGIIRDIDLPEDIKEIFKSIWDINTEDLISFVRMRAGFIDQSQSMNLYSTDDHDQIIKYLYMGWKKGLKTGCYYLHSQPINPLQYTDCTSCTA